MRFSYTTALRSSSGLLRRPTPITRPAALQLRFASEKPMQAVPGAEPGTSSNVRPTNPEASSADASAVNHSRSLDSKSGSPDTASVQTPVSNPSQAGAAMQEEPQPSQENMRRDPSEPAEDKREAVEREGQKPLDAADK